jgi:2',3'-cyclic-nucleotide 2'-phosphodiesterase (5'-nucleotidase family)
MKTASFRLVLAAAALAGSAGCIAYNEQCQGLVDNPDEVVGYIAAPVFLDKPNARHDNNAIGQMEADAFVDAFSDSSRKPDFGVVNGGGIRAEGLCVTRNILPVGPLKKGVIHEILLFENLVKAVDLTEPEVVLMMEHSVERLSPVGTPIVSPAGQFLQVSSAVQMQVDCSKPVGQRVTSLKIGNNTLAHPGDPAKKYRVALTAFLLGGDGYSMLVAPAADPSREPAQAQRLGGTDGNLTADYMKRTYNKDQASGLKKDPNRVSFTGSDGGVTCAVPPAPAG